MARRDGRKLMYQIQLISTQQSRHVRQDRIRLDTAVKCEDRDDRGARRHLCHRQGYWGIAGAALDRRPGATIAPWLQAWQDQTLTATSSAAANEVPSMGLFGGLQMRNPWVAFVSATKRFALLGALAMALISEGAR